MKNVNNEVRTQTPEVTEQNRKRLADQYRDLLKVAGTYRTLLLQGIENLGGINETNRAEFEALDSADLITRIQLTINDLDPKPVEYSHGISTKQVTATVAAETSEQITAVVTQPELSPELQEGLAQIHQNFDNMPDLHPGIEWEEVAIALSADQESLKAFIEANKNGYSVNVFGKEDGHLIFVTAQLDVRKVTEQHKNIMFDAQAQRDYPQYKVNGNAETVATDMGMELADEKYHKKLRALYGDKMHGAFYLKTDEATRKAGNARFGLNLGVYHCYADSHNGYLAARFSRRVKTT